MLNLNEVPKLKACCYFTDYTYKAFSGLEILGEIPFPQEVKLRAPDNLLLKYNVPKQ
jgi:hypothetical protein